MSVANITELRDIVYGQFKTAWGTISSAPPVIYDDKEESAPTEGPYADVSIRHGASDAASIGSRSGRLWRSEASLIVDIYDDVGRGRDHADVWTAVVQVAFRGKHSPTGDIWYRSVRVAELNPSGSRSKTRVVVDLEYTETI